MLVETQRIGVAAPTAALHPDRFFDPDPSVLRAARAIFERTTALPLVCPHGHVDPRLLAENAAFPEPTALFITPDHYIFRLLYSRGISMDTLGIPRRDGTPPSADPRRVWQIFAENYYLFRGTPTGIWFDYQLHELFGVRDRLNGDTAAAIYDEVSEKLRSPEFRPRALFDHFHIEALATTDAATDDLRHHRAIQASGWKGRVIPTFRPDALFRIATPAWEGELAKLRTTVGPIGSVEDFLVAIADRRSFFRQMGATATDHAVVEPFTARLSRAELNAIFARALTGEATPADQRAFEAHMLMEMARMSTEDGLVMQLHPGSFRDHNPEIAHRHGPDVGADIPVATEYTRNLRALLSEYGNDPRLTLVLFTLDESAYARELAPLAGHYPALRLGPPWWFHDSIEGMMRFREATSETASIYKTAGFNDDTRAFCSIPARHDLSRRVDANWLARMVVRHVIDIDDAHHMAHALAYGLVKETYRLGGGRT